MTTKTDKSFYFRGKSIFSSDMSELLTLVTKAIKSQTGPFLIFTPNPEQLVLAEQQPSFDLELKVADLLLPDGIGLVLASRVLRNQSNREIAERLPGRVVAAKLLGLAKENNQTVLVIGGQGYSSTDHFFYEGLQCHWTPGYKKVASPTAAEEASLKQLLQTLRPALVLVAFGAPHQEHWLVTHRELLAESDVRVGMAVGGTFDFLLGKVPTPPTWVSRYGGEWLFRLITQPWRFFRQLRLIVFVVLVVREKLFSK